MVTGPVKSTEAVPPIVHFRGVAAYVIVIDFGLKFAPAMVQPSPFARSVSARDCRELALIAPVAVTSKV